MGYILSFVAILIAVALAVRAYTWMHPWHEHSKQDNRYDHFIN